MTAETPKHDIKGKGEDISIGCNMPATIPVVDLEKKQQFYPPVFQDMLQMVQTLMLMTSKHSMLVKCLMTKWLKF